MHTIVELTDSTPPIEAVEAFYALANALRESGIPETDLPLLEKAWLRRRDIPAHLYDYATAAFLAGFTGRPRPGLIAAE